MCKETAENGEWSKEWSSARNIAAKVLYNYAIWENSQQETKQFCHLFTYLFIYLFIYFSKSSSKSGNC